MSERNRVRFTNFLHTQTDLCFDWLREWARDHPNTIAYGEDKNGRVTMKYHREWIVNCIGENAIAMHECGFVGSNGDGCLEIKIPTDMFGWRHWVVKCKCDKKGIKHSRDETSDEFTLERTEDDNTYLGFIKEKDYKAWVDSLP